MTSWYVVLIINGNLYLSDVMYATQAECERELVQAQVLISHAGECRESPLLTVEQPTAPNSPETVTKAKDELKSPPIVGPR
jgi:hypothetical protein